MGAAWGTVLVVLGLICWVGQAVSWLAPPTALRLGLTDDEDEVEPAFYAHVRGEAAWDTLSTWTMVVAGVLLVLDNSAWALFGLVGGGTYVYFAGLGISSRIQLLRRNLRIGPQRDVRVAFAFLTIWGVMASITIVAAWTSLD